MYSRKSHAANDLQKILLKLWNFLRIGQRSPAWRDPDLKI